jgi:hypothetical protein
LAKIMNHDILRARLVVTRIILHLISIGETFVDSRSGFCCSVRLTRIFCVLSFLFSLL